MKKTKREIIDAYLAQELPKKEKTGPDLSRTLQVLREFREELGSFVAPANGGGWSLSNLPTHFWETLGGCINDLEEHTKERTGG